MSSTTRARVKEMFFHAYNNYKNNAFPADELMPLTCKGRYRWSGFSRGDIDDALGNFSLTMLDGLDSLFLIGELDEFEAAVRAVVRTVRFDSDVDVSVFETNIRVIGGLLGAHVAVLSVKQNNNSRMGWYKNELLQMAVDVGSRLLPAFDTPTGIPYPRINLRYGNSGLTKQEENTCTACAGTMILEFAALSRLTGNPIFERKAAKAMAFLWKQRNRYSDLVGRVINVRNGDWIRQESGVGAGIDSYYEYLLKAYILLGEPVYLHRFQTHYEAINRYVGGPQSAEFPFLFLDVHMHRPAQRARTFMDALLAFWPGIQVLTGDVKRAVALHELLYLIHKRNKLLPEAFTPDFNVHWGQHLLRPELIESTYLLYRATEDPYYLQVGEQIVNDLEKYTRVPCGFAAIKDVRTMEHVDQFDSFVLAETFKYLYLLFAEPSDIPINVDDYIFTTEAHLLPLSLSRQRYPTDVFSTMIDNVSSILMNSSQQQDSTTMLPTLSTSNIESISDDHHGDRDVKVEKLLHSAAQCIAVGYEHRSPIQCILNASITRNNTTNTTTIVTTDDDNKHNRNDNTDNSHQYHSELTCDLSETNGYFYGHYVKHKLPKCRNSNSNKFMSKSCIWDIIDGVRQPVRQIAINLDQSVNDYSTHNIHHNKFTTTQPPLKAIDFQPDNNLHLNILKSMGISMSFNQDGRLTLTHHHNSAENLESASAGVLFIQELIALTNQKQNFVDLPVQRRYVVVVDPPSYGFVKFAACPAHFGLFPGEALPAQRQQRLQQEVEEHNRLNVSESQADGQQSSSSSTNLTDKRSWKPLIGPVRVVFPLDACQPIVQDAYAYPSFELEWNQNPTESLNSSFLNNSEVMWQSKGSISGAIGIVRRGGCVFVEKAYHLAQAGAIGVIIVDNKPDTSSEVSPLFSLSGDNDLLSNKIHIPVVLLMGVERDKLLNIMRTHWNHSNQPINVMLTKEYDAGESFNSALSVKYSDSEIVNQSSFELISDLYQSTLPTSNELSFNRLSESVSFILLHNSTLIDLRNSTSNIFNKDNTFNSWSFVFSMNHKELSNYFIPVNNSEDQIYNAAAVPTTQIIKGFPKNITVWRDLFYSTLKQVGINNDCHHLILAFIQISLHKLSPSNSSYHTTKAINVSIEYYQLLNSCLMKTIGLCCNRTGQYDAPVADNLPSEIVITLQLGFQFSSNVPSTSTITSSFPSSTSPHSHVSLSSEVDGSSKRNSDSLYNDEL
ncbi:ER degradation-enhancing alpha-mannosidase-like protein [Schistosoma japonicum]|uniref:alpha-1,2-Mannosidase n=1 Tax=Schistosoma japonicum TaxID=6182 RepID=A0A4Z2CST2_SCHJA|nr:ER degradation-enhancing alpha-mannosidase-like protein [Schistosoma japonicum]